MAKLYVTKKGAQIQRHWKEGEQITVNDVHVAKFLALGVCSEKPLKKEHSEEEEVKSKKTNKK